MNNVEDIKQHILNLSLEQRAELRDWLWKLDGLMPLDAEPSNEPDSALDADESQRNPGHLVEDVMAKIRKNL
jgi:hypothetical protein